MSTLDECKKLIWDLAKQKKWSSDPERKIYYSILELAEAGDIWKHRDDPDYLKEIKVTDINLAIAEELIDTIYYCLHCLMCIDPSISADEVFKSKHEINEKRNRIYADDMNG